MERGREGRVYRARQLPNHLKTCDDTARFLARVAPVLGNFDSIRIFSLAAAGPTYKTATISFKDLPSMFDNDDQQWTVQAKDLCGWNIIVDIHFREFTVLSEPHPSTYIAE